MRDARTGRAFKPAFEVTGIGSLPHSSPELAVSDILEFCPERPYWPQLPRASAREDMYRQFSRGLPGFVWDDASAGPRWRRDEAAMNRLEAVYRDALALGSAAPDSWGIDPEDALGLEALRQALSGREGDAARSLEGAGRLGVLRGLKGQIIGPVSLGLAVTDDGGRALLYEEDLMDGVARGLALRARWELRYLQGLLDGVVGGSAGVTGSDATGPDHRVLLSVDEPYLGTFGSAYFPYRPETVLGYLTTFDETLEAAFWGIHCCANTDWEFVLASPARFVSFDAWAFGDRLVLYPEAVKAFIDAGKVLIWGLVPTDPVALSGTDRRALLEKLRGYLDTLVKRGVSESALTGQSMLSPACGLAGLSVEEARRAMSLADVVSKAARAEFNL